MTFLVFRPFFTVSLGMGKLSSATVNCILKQSGQISFMITTGSLNSQDMIRILEDMISQVNIYVVDIVRILCDVYVWKSKFRVF